MRASFALSYEPDENPSPWPVKTGKVRQLIDAANAKVVSEFVPVPVGASPLANQTVKLEPK